MVEITVVIPTYNRQPRLQRVLTALAEQSHPLADFEVIVISDGSTDETLDYLAHVQLPYQLRTIAQGNQGAAAARNRGIQAAQGDIVLFIDDDVMPTATLIAEHLHMHHDAQTDVVVLGPMLTPTDFVMTPWVRWEQAMLIKQYNDMESARWQPTARQFYTGNASVARAHLLAVGGFDSTFRRAEDVELAYRLAERGLTFLFNPHAIGYHYAERSFASWLCTPYDYGHNDVIFARDHGQSWLMQTVAGEFYERHWLTRSLTVSCLSRRIIGFSAIQGLRQLATIATKWGFSQLAGHAYSGIFNLQYYQGMADTLGGRQPFLKLIKQRATFKPAFCSLLPRRSSSQNAKDSPV